MPAARETKARNVAFTWGATRRHMAAYREAKAIVDSGEVGGLRQILVKLGLAALQWTHPHSVDTAAYFAGDADIVAARAVFAEPARAQGLVVDADPKLQLGFLKFANGITAIVTAAGGHDIVLSCERGEVAVLANGTQIAVRRMRGGYLREVTTTMPNPVTSGLQNALTSLRDFVTSGTPCGFDFDRACAFQRALFALALSGCEGGRAVDPGEVPDDFTLTGRQGNLYA